MEHSKLNTPAERVLSPGVRAARHAIAKDS